MGEYARHNGEQVKIGTCESMYYLRHDQRHEVVPERGSVDPVKQTTALLFRFPWPDEDHIAPGSGEFHDKGYDRSINVPGFTVPGLTGHGHVQFTASAGYNVCLPCPESDAYHDNHESLGASSARLLRDTGLRVFRNGFRGAVHLVAQKEVEGGRLVPVIRCGGCGAMWRLEDRSEVERLAVALRCEGDRRERRGDGVPSFWHKVADRVLAGLLQEA